MLISSIEALDVNSQIVELIEEREKEYARERVLLQSKVIGAERLKAEHLDLDYRSKRMGTKAWCICDDIDLRISYIAWAKNLKAKARSVYERWRLGDFSEAYPPGVFPPAVPKLSNMTKLSTEL